MAINSDTDINLALLQLGKTANRYRLDQNVVPHKIIEWDSANSDSQPTDDELNTAYTAWKMLMNIKRKEKKPIQIGKHKWICNTGIVLMVQRHGKMLSLK